jgi:hypothetical protein
MLAKKTGQVEMVSVFEILYQGIHREAIRPGGDCCVEGGCVMGAIRASCSRAIRIVLERECASRALKTGRYR